MRARLRRLRSLSPLEVLTLAHAFAWLVVVEVLVRRTRLPRACRWLGITLDADSGPAPDEGTPPPTLTPRAEEQLWAAWVLAERWPYADGPCLRRSMVAARLIRRHDPVLRLGVALRDEGILAHAWLEVEGHPLEDLGDLLAFQKHSPGAP